MTSMFKKIGISGAVLGALLFMPSLSAAPSEGDGYYDNLMSVIAPPHSQVAVIAKDLASDTLIYQHNADTLLLPASTQKLLTALAAKAQLGDEFRFTTRFQSKAKVIQGTLKGNLYLLFSGDPTLTTENLRDLLKALADKGVRQIEGNLLLVGESDEQTRAPGWVWDDLGICYAAPVSSFVINQNCVLGQLKPKLASNDSILKFPRYQPIKVSTTAKFDKTQQEPFCELRLARLPDNHFHLSGCYPGDKALNLAIAVDDPALFAKQTMAQLLKTANIKLKGELAVASHLPAGLSTLASHDSNPLPALLEVMLQDSDNLIADSLFKAIGASYYRQAGNFVVGAKAVKAILGALGIDLSHAQIIDGSGLSRYNLLSAQQLAQVLTVVAKDERFDELIDLLPVAGVSGTLTYKRGYRQAPLKTRVAAKTGSMQGVDNLAGFLNTYDKQQLLFVVLENGQSSKSKKESLAPFSALFLQSLFDTKQQVGSKATNLEESAAVDGSK